MYESTELMNLYLDGNEEAGKAMKTKGYLHLGLTMAFAGASKLAKPVSTAFAKSKLGQGFLNLKPIVAVRELGYNVSGICGKYLMDGFANSKYGVIGALDVLNELSLKYAGMLCDFLAEYGTPIAENAAETYYNGGKEAVEERIDGLKGSEAKHSTKYDNINIDDLAANNPTELKRVISDIRQTGGSPVEIPSEADASALAKTMNKGYQQIKYRWSEGVYNFEARWHTETPGAMKYERGTTWVVTQTIPGTPKGQERVTEYLVGDT